MAIMKYQEAADIAEKLKSLIDGSENAKDIMDQAAKEGDELEDTDWQEKANELEKIMASNGLHTMLLDGDNVRLGINKDLEGYRPEEGKRANQAHRLFIPRRHGRVPLACGKL